jgi:gliding motility-associated-like protein
MKKILTILLLFLSSISLSQNVTLCLGQDATICPTQTVTINDCNNIGGGSSVGSAQYSAVNIPYSPDPFNLGTPITLSDDAISSAQNIGFSFCFFGNTYTQFYIGSNGWVGFTAGQTTAFTSATIPSTAANIPKNCIMGPWQDWHPGTGNGGPYIRYQVLGTAPNRRLVVSWNNCPMFSCTSSLGTFQIVLFESTNNIETRIQNKPNCPAWAGGTSVHGIHNLAGNLAIVVPGRNSTQWTTTNNAWRFTPQVVWGNTLGQTFPYSGGVLNINPVPPGTTGYFLKSGCSVGGNGNAISDTTWITVVNPTVTVNTTPDICDQSLGSVTAVPGSSSVGPYSYSWVPGGGTTSTINNLGVGTYSVTVIDGNGCTANGSGTITNNSIALTNTFNVNDISCYGLNDGSIIGQNTLYTYNWSNGGTNQSINNLSTGSYTVTYSLGSCDTTETFIISQPDSIRITSISNDTTICLGDIVNLFGTSNVPSIFNWSNGLIGSSINFTPTTNQILCLEVKNQCNPNDIDTACLNVNVQSINGNFYFSQNPVTVETPSVNLIGSGGNSYEWNSIFQGSSLGNEYTALLTGISGDFIFRMIVENNLGCIDTVYNTLTINENYNIFIPNSFTPDGNEFNQYWKPVIYKIYDIKDYNLKIFNRWGETIWESNDPLEGWDGTFSKGKCQDGIYLWKLSFIFSDDAKKIENNGHILLVR